MKKILFWSLLLTHPPALASAECDWSMQVAKDETQRIGSQTAALNNLNAALAIDKGVLDTNLLPLLDARERTMSVYDHQSQAISDSQIAVRQAVIFVQGTIISNRGLKILLNQLKNQTHLSTDSNLSEQIHAAATNGHVNSATKTQLNQLANAVALVENEQSTWKTSETEILQSYLQGKESLVDGLLDKLNQLNERLASDLKDLESGHTQDAADATEAEKNVTDMQNKISGELNQITALQKANEASQADMARWNVKTYCMAVERPSLIPSRAK